MRARQAIVDLGFRGLDADNPGVDIIHRGMYKTLTAVRHWINRRQAIEPMIGHTKSDHRIDRCWLKGAFGDALRAITCAAGYDILWLMRAIVAQAAKATKAALLTLSKPELYGLNGEMHALTDLRDVLSLIRIAVRASLGPPLPAVPVGVSLGWH